jgi:hypothetical protein
MHYCLPKRASINCGSLPVAGSEPNLREPGVTSPWAAIGAAQQPSGPVLYRPRNQSMVSRRNGFRSLDRSTS